MRTTVEMGQKEVEQLLIQTFGTQVLHNQELRVEDMHCYFYSTGGGHLTATITDDPLPVAEPTVPPEVVDAAFAQMGYDTEAKPAEPTRTVSYNVNGDLITVPVVDRPDCADDIPF